VLVSKFVLTYRPRFSSFCSGTVGEQVSNLFLLGSHHPYGLNTLYLTPHPPQADVFEELSQLVQSSLDGYKVSIMSYGQTGSGKTFTMEGPTVDARNEQAGMQPESSGFGFLLPLMCFLTDIACRAIPWHGMTTVVLLSTISTRLDLMSNF
jgi:hypothetical protein